MPSESPLYSHIDSGMATRILIEAGQNNQGNLRQSAWDWDSSRFSNFMYILERKSMPAKKWKVLLKPMLFKPEQPFLNKS